MKSRRPKRRHDRRATILLMVVTLLALLFVIVTGFLSVARNDRGNVKQVLEGDVAGTIVKDTIDLTTDLVSKQLVDSDGNVLGGSGGSSYSYEDIPGYRFSNYLASLEPVWTPDWSVSNTTYASWANGGSWSIIDQMQWPAVTSLDAGMTSPPSFRLWELLWDYNARKTTFRKVDIKWNARDGFADADGDGMPDSHYLLGALATELANAKTGRCIDIPDYDYLATKPGDEGEFKLYDQFGGLFGGHSLAQLENIRQQLEDNTRYQVAVRVVSHGGMVALDSPTLHDVDNPGSAYAPFNRDFVMDMFDAIRGTRDTSSLSQLYPNAILQNALFDDLAASTADVELTLRRRLLLPPPQQWGDNGNDKVRALPAVLGKLFDQFADTFLHTFALQGAGGDGLSHSYERINLADDTDRDAYNTRYGWAKAITCNPQDYNDGDYINPAQGEDFDRRHMLTSFSRSDELARKLSGDEPTPTVAKLFDIGTYNSELKFYLGEISKAFVEVNPASGAETSGTGHFAYDAARGNVIVERLARLYYDMLAGHSDSTNDWGDITDPNDSAREVVSRRQQAFMLAVNTIAFAMPRTENSTYRGYTGVVSYADTVLPSVPIYGNLRGNGTGAGDNLYVGYTPQMFFSEAIAHRVGEFDPNDPNAPDPNDPNYPLDPNSSNYDDPNSLNIAIGVELYNPNDPYYDGSTDTYGDVDLYGLYLPQFAVSVNGHNPNTDPTGTSRKWVQLSPFRGFGQRLNGRSFMYFVIKGGPNGQLSIPAQPYSPEVSLDIDDPGSGEPFSLVLWKSDWRDVSGTPVQVWFPIDEIIINEATSGSPLPNEGAWKCAYRDTSPSRYHGWADFNGNGIADDYARWNILTQERRTGSSVNATPLVSSIGDSSWLRSDTASPSGLIESPDPNMPNGGLRTFSPTTPLITMNAGRVNDGSALWQQFNNYRMFDNARDLRPRSYPTVGFLLFLSRYAHVQNLGAAGGSTKDRIIPITQALERAWKARSYRVVPPGPLGGAMLQGAEYPADFGFMPIFDNSQGGLTGYIEEVTRDDASGGGSPTGIPWGMLVFDYFTTLNPWRDINGDGAADVDPLAVPGRININTAPWFVLANLPMLGPTNGSAGAVSDPYSAELPVRVLPPGSAVSSADPSPSFWEPYCGLLVGVGADPFPTLGMAGGIQRQLATDSTFHGGLFGLTVPWKSDATGRHRLGPWLAQSAVAYRDGVQYLPYTSAANAQSGYGVFATSQLRSGPGDYRASGSVVATSGDKYREADSPAIYGTPYKLYGSIRGQRTNVVIGDQKADAPCQFGFVSIGELANVKGFDSSTYRELIDASPYVAGILNTTLSHGDYLKAVSVLALLDSQYLTTRSNTFTVYTSVIDRDEPQRSVHSQTTIDRSNLLPRLSYAFYDATSGAYYSVAQYLSDASVNNLPVVPLLRDLDDNGIPETPVRTNNATAEPRVIAHEEVGYFNAAQDN